MEMAGGGPEWKQSDPQITKKGLQLFLWTESVVGWKGGESWERGVTLSDKIQKAPVTFECQIKFFTI